MTAKAIDDKAVAATVREYVTRDVGIRRTDKGMCGDVDYERIRDIAGAITSVHGYASPMTIAMLLCNMLPAAQS